MSDLLREALGGGWAVLETLPVAFGARAALALLPLVLVALWLERRAGGGRLAMVLRASITLCLVLALARPVLGAAGRPGVVLLVDRSASVADGAVDDALTALGAAGARVPVLAVGDATHSPLAAGLDRAARALAGGGRVVLVSDGRSTGGDPVAAAGRLAAGGVRVDVVSVPARDGPDAVLTALDAPAVWRAGDAIPLALTVRADRPLTGTLTLRADGATVATEQVALEAGRTTLSTRFVPDGPGPVRFTARLDAPLDAEPGNDEAHAMTHVAPAPRVLVVGDGPGAVALADLLLAERFPTTVLGTTRLPGRLSALEAWDALVLVDVAASALGVDQLGALEAYVADRGGGLVLTGGRQSYLAGGWEATALEALAPVRLEPPPRDEREAIALVLLVDQSASMGTVANRRGVTKLDLAREAAILATEVLHPGDRLGVVAYDNDARWLVPPSTIGVGRAVAEVESVIASLATGGGTRILNALELGLPALADLDVPTRHAVLLTDGRDFNLDARRYDDVVAAARTAGVTLSTIAIGFDADRDLLARLARLGRGRYYSADDPTALPRLTVEESEIVRARSEQRGDFRASPSAVRHPLLAEVAVDGLPPLSGYLATTPREAAAVALEAPNGDPLLAAWNYGLGRVVGWTSDTGEAWAAGWRRASAARAVWARMVRYAARAPESRPPGVTVTPTVDGARVEVDVVDDVGRAVDLAEVTLVVSGTVGTAGDAPADGAGDEDAAGAVSVELPQVAPGLYAGAVALPAPGVYPAAVRVRGGERDLEAPVVLAREGPPELYWTGDGGRMLEALAAAGGGAVHAPAALSLPAAPQARVALGPWLAALAAVLWVMEVGRQMGGVARLRPRWLVRMGEGLGEERE